MTTTPHNTTLDFATQLERCPVIAILRGITAADICQVCDALFEAGITLLEVPLNSPDPCVSIARAASHCRGRQLVGAGTVLSPRDVQRVREAGGTFIISPNVNPEVIRETKRLGLLSIPGFFTATEGFTALEAGADYLKLFPAGRLGPQYIRDLKAVITTPILAVGGVTLDTLPGFLQVCHGAGIGSAIYRPGKAPEQVLQDARAIVTATQMHP